MSFFSDAHASIHVDWGIKYLLGIGVALSDSTSVVAPLDLKEALVTPGCTPRVLDNPVIQSSCSVSAIADSEDSMVYRVSGIVADGWVVDSSSVIAESSNDLETYWYWSFLEKSIPQLAFISSCNIDWATLYSNPGVDVIWVAPLWHVCNIRVILLASDASSVFDIFKSVRRKSTMASMIVECTGAINKLLFTEVSELTIGKHVVGFETPNSRRSSSSHMSPKPWLESRLQSLSSPSLQEQPHHWDAWPCFAK